MFLKRYKTSLEILAGIKSIPSYGIAATKQPNGVIPSSRWMLTFAEMTPQAIYSPMLI